MTILVITVVAVLVVIVLALVRAFLGPSIYDQVLAVNIIGTKTVLLICLINELSGRSDYLDIALVYALISYIGVIAMLRFIQPRDANLHNNPKQPQ